MPEDAPDGLRQQARAAAIVAPGLAALAWLEDTLAGRFEAAWGGLDPEFRLALVQQWLSSDPGVLGLVEEDRDALAGQLASARPSHWLWRAHGQKVLRRDVERLWSEVCAGSGTGSGPDRAPSPRTCRP
ncbi:hypothetical protein [Aquipuribacter hungaricus]|uniref:Uncharacterized protein n=1 Tax=Aquipuribacter hungaricus TaxID=545624 RepID=A0ABV7WKG3_9MICO